MATSDVFVIVEHIRGEVSEITDVLLAAGRQLVEKTGGKLTAIYLGTQGKELANRLGADKILILEHPSLEDFIPEIYLQALTGIIQERKPSLVLLGDTSIGSDMAGALSLRLNCPLLSSCRKLEHRDGKIMFAAQICGGKIMVEGPVPEPLAVIAMIPGGYKLENLQSATPAELENLHLPESSGIRMRVKGYIEPEAGDVDISKEEILVSVGRGIQNEENLQYAQELANAMGGVLVASRPIVDQNWLPPSRLVGKSGKKVKPKIYLALGISGAPEHVEALGGSEVIIAVNTDPSAPIFGIAKYGTTVDLLDLAPVLTEKIQEIKSAVKMAS